MAGRKIGVVVPLRDEAEGFPELRRRLSAALDSLGLDYEVVCVDDGSTDGTFERLKATHAEDPRWRALSLSRNFGHGAACTAGLDHADADAVVFIDGDLQDPPELIPKLVAKWKEGFQVVYAVRTGRPESWPRRALTSLFYRLLHGMSNVSLPVDAGIFSLLDRAAAESLRRLPERHRYLTGLRAWIGYSQASVEYEREARRSDAPRQTAARLAALALDALFGFSTAPLRVAALLGAVLATGSMALAAKVLYEKLFTNKPIIGWSSTMIAITLTGGAILFTLGVIGEYVGRIYDEIKARPIYLIRERLG